MYGAPIRAQSTIGNEVITTLNNQITALEDQMQPLPAGSLQQLNSATTGSQNVLNGKQFSLHRANDIMANLNQQQQQESQQQLQHHQQQQQQDQKLNTNRNYVNQLLASGQQPQYLQFAQNQNLVQNICIAGSNLNNNIGQPGAASNNGPHNNDSTLSFGLDELGAIINSKDFEELVAEAKNITPSQQNFPFQSTTIMPSQQQQQQQPQAADATGAYQGVDAHPSASTTPRSQSRNTNERQFMTPVEESSVDNRINNAEYYHNDQETSVDRQRVQSARTSVDERQSTMHYNTNHFVGQNLIQAQQIHQLRQSQDRQLELGQHAEVGHLTHHQTNYTHTKTNDISTTNQQHNSPECHTVDHDEVPINKREHNNERQQLDLLPLMAPVDRGKPYVEIVEHPAKCALRFRYKCEGRSAGSLPGVNSTADHKTYPSIRIANHFGRSVVVISCVTKDPPYRAHPHNIVGKEGCKKGVCTIVLNNDPNTVKSFSIGIQCVKRKDVEESLALRKSINVDPFRNGFAHKSCPSNIDLNVVRLCFQVFIEGSTPNKCDVPLVPVVSDPIHDKKAMSELVITKLSHCSAPATGGREIILLCDRISKDDIKVRFYQEKDGKVIWETYTDIAPTDVHKQVAICLKTPKYYNENITQPVMARIQLKRVSDNQLSEPRLFQFLPCESDEDIISRKRQKIEWVNMMNG